MTGEIAIFPERSAKSSENQGLTTLTTSRETVKIQKKSYICTPQNGISG
jgi:hypothetical protein